MNIKKKIALCLLVTFAFFHFKSYAAQDSGSEDDQSYVTWDDSCCCPSFGKEMPSWEAMKEQPLLYEREGFKEELTCLSTLCPCRHKLEECTKEALDKKVEDLSLSPFDINKWPVERCKIVALMCIGAFKHRKRDMFHLLKSAIIRRDHKLAYFLLDNGADVKERSLYFGHSVLYYDILFNVADTSLTKRLIEAGAEAEKTSWVGQNSLHNLAFECECYDDPDVILGKARLLIGAGAGIDEDCDSLPVDSEGKTALQLAEESRMRYAWQGAQSVKACDVLIEFLEKYESTRLQD